MLTRRNVYHHIKSSSSQQITGFVKISIHILCRARMHTHTQCIFPLQQVKGNHSRVQAALNELKTLARSMLVQTHTKGCLLEGLQEALAQFHRMAQSMRQVRKTVLVPMLDLLSGPTLPVGSRVTVGSPC